MFKSACEKLGGKTGCLKGSPLALQNIGRGAPDTRSIIKDGGAVRSSTSMERHYFVTTRQKVTNLVSIARQMVSSDVLHRANMGYADDQNADPRIATSTGRNGGTSAAGQDDTAVGEGGQSEGVGDTEESNMRRARS